MLDTTPESSDKATIKEWTDINAIGGLVISALTLIAAVYLWLSLWRQGRGKLRVRLLLGMVISDVLLG